MKKNILFFIITLLTCSFQYLYPGMFGKKVVINYSGIAEAFHNKAATAKTRAEYDKITADYAEFIKKYWPANKSVPPLPSYQQTV